MSFDSIKIPTRIGFSPVTRASLEMETSALGEDVDKHIFAGIGFAVFWGSIIREQCFAPEFTHGVFSPQQRRITEKIDVPQLALFSAQAAAQRRSDALSLGIDITNDYEPFVYPIDDVFHEELRAACAYFGVDALSLLGVAIDLRRKVLEKQKDGNAYGYYFPNQESISVLKLQIAI